MGEKEIMVSTPFPTEYVEEDEEALETSFQALEIVGTTNIKIGKGDINPSKAAIMAAKVLITNGFEPGKGLGRRLNGMANPPHMPTRKTAHSQSLSSGIQAPSISYIRVNPRIVRVILAHSHIARGRPRESPALAPWSSSHVLIDLGPTASGTPK
ncbi:hypothetical protein CR513_04949, partial [Mucuna pruriens]